MCGPLNYCYNVIGFNILGITIIDIMSTEKEKQVHRAVMHHHLPQVPHHLDIIHQRQQRPTKVVIQHLHTIHQSHREAHRLIPVHLMIHLQWNLGKIHLEYMLHHPVQYAMMKMTQTDMHHLDQDGLRGLVGQLPILLIALDQ